MVRPSQYPDGKEEANALLYAAGNQKNRTLLYMHESKDYPAFREITSDRTYLVRGKIFSNK